jgi:hypothetical protein
MAIIITATAIIGPVITTNARHMAGAGINPVRSDGTAAAASSLGRFGTAHRESGAKRARTPATNRRGSFF